MQIDRASLEKLLTLNDRQLKAVVDKIAAESGIDLSSFSLNPSDIAGIRAALSSATDEDLKRVSQQYEAYKRGQGKK